jgi:hypothetical protein
VRFRQLLAQYREAVENGDGKNPWSPTNAPIVSLQPL